MKFDQYSCDDVNMYIADTFTMHEGKPLRIHYVRYLDGEGDTVDSVEDADTVYVEGLTAKDGDIVNTSFRLWVHDTAFTKPIPLGYYTIGDFAVFFYKKQENFYKKLPHARTIRTFIPQSREFEYIRKNYGFDLNKVLLQNPVYETLDNAYRSLTEKNKFSVALHRNYALVKKGKYKHPVVYYRTTPVIEYNGKDLIPLIDECHVHKFKLEVSNEGRL